MNALSLEITGHIGSDLSSVLLYYVPKLASQSFQIHGDKFFRAVFTVVSCDDMRSKRVIARFCHVVGVCVGGMSPI